MVEKDIYTKQSDKYVPVPCGKCPNCLKRRVQHWTHRLEMESLNWERLYFVTLTYDTTTVPISQNNFMTLCKEDVQKFFKRLRRSSGKCAYYMCGEYGTKNERPHYHIILYANAGMTHDDIVIAWRTEEGADIGNVHFGDVEAGSITYTVQYYDKGIWKPKHKNDDRVPEYSAMSNGLGKRFLSKDMVKHLLCNPDKGYIYNTSGHKISIPRYYKKRLYDYIGGLQNIATHPSILGHHEEMQNLKKLHNEALAEQSPPDIEDSEERNEARRWAIINYRNSKTKTRKL